MQNALQSIVLRNKKFEAFFFHLRVFTKLDIGLAISAERKKERKGEKRKKEIQGLEIVKEMKGRKKNNGGISFLCHGKEKKE